MKDIIIVAVLAFALGFIVPFLDGSIKYINSTDSGMYVEVDGVMHKLIRIEPNE